MRQKFITRFALLVMAVLVTVTAAGCAGQNTTPTAVTADLLGIEWNLTELNGAAPLPESTTTLTLKDGQVGGRAGCNSYGGSYTLQDSQLAFKDLFTTEMACMDPAGIMDQEQVFLQALNQVTGFEVNDGGLALKDASGAVILRFEQ